VFPNRTAAVEDRVLFQPLAVRLGEPEVAERTGDVRQELRHRRLTTYTDGMAVVFCEIEAPRGSVPNGETHVYAAPLHDAGPYGPMLTPDERDRASRFRLARVRDQFVAARGRLRALLGHYLRLPPQEVPVLYADGGKPH